MKRVNFLVIALLCTALATQSYAQEKDHLSSKKGETSLGIGLGLPYGGIGGRIGTNVTYGLTIFGGLGYMISGVGYNIGLLKDFPSKASTQFYLSAMFGTNAAIRVEGLSEYNEVYTGPSFGLGIKINSRRKEGNFWDIGLQVPITSQAFKDDEMRVENDPRVGDFTDPLPVLIVVGYNFNL